MQIITPKSKDHWLALRHQDVTSTESAALFGLSPYMTEFELYHRKIDPTPIEIEETERMKWGSRLEPVIAQGISEDFGVIIKPFKEYVRHDNLRMGSSFDYLITGAGDDVRNEISTAFLERGRGILEIKNVDYFIHKDYWMEGEAPVHIEIQVQHQLEATGYEWAVICPFVGGNCLKPLIRIRDRDMGANIVAAINKFWKDVAVGNEPAPDFNRDAEFIAKLYGEASDDQVDLTDNSRARIALEEYILAGELEKQAKERKEAAKTEVLLLMKNAKKAYADGYTVSASTVSETTYTATRKAYRNFRVTRNK